MTPEEREQKIVSLVKKIDSIRESEFMSPEVKAQEIAAVDAEIKVLKGGGQRHITGQMHL